MDFYFQLPRQRKNNWKDIGTIKKVTLLISKITQELIPMNAANFFSESYQLLMHAILE